MMSLNQWRVGDLAVCVLGPACSWYSEDVCNDTSGPQPEQVLMVVDVQGALNFGRHGSVGLSFREFPEDYYPASLFRKIRPDDQPADNLEIIALIKGRQPVSHSVSQFPVAVSPASASSGLRMTIIAPSSSASPARPRPS